MSFGGPGLSRWQAPRVRIISNPVCDKRVMLQESLWPLAVIVLGTCKYLKPSGMTDDARVHIWALGRRRSPSWVKRGRPLQMFALTTSAHPAHL